MEYSNTLRWFSELAEDCSAESCLSYCLPAIASLKQRLKDSSITVDRVPQLAFAAAAIAFYKYSLTNGFPDVAYLKAGDITVRRSKAEYGESLRTLLSVALTDAAPYLKTAVKLKSIGGGGDA